MPLITIEDTIKEIKAGRMVILVDDEDRENEGDLTMAAEAVTPEAINFMAKYGRPVFLLATVLLPSGQPWQKTLNREILSGRGMYFH